jgi:hypothetical protein
MKNNNAVVCLVLILIIHVLTSHSFSTRFNRYNIPQLYSKKKGKVGTSEGIKLGKGFGSAVQQEEKGKIEESEEDVLNPMVYSGADNLLNNDLNFDNVNDRTPRSTLAPGEVLQSKSTDAVFKKYGIGKGSTDRFGNTVEKKPEKKMLKPGQTRPFGEAVLERFDAKTLNSIDNTLITGAFGSLTLVVLTGIGISSSALEVVFPNFKLGPDFDNLVTNVMIPGFTPVVVLFFAFSITYGLFKFAQVSSDQSVYKEP